MSFNVDTKRKLDFSPHTTNKQRKVVAGGQNVPYSSDSGDLDKALPQHAKERTLIDCVNLHFWAGRDVRSDGTYRNIQFSGMNAPFQYGKGNRLTNTHGSHPGAYYPHDNVKQLWIDERWNEKKLTPKKENALSYMLPPEDLQKLKDPNLSKPEIASLIGKGPLLRNSEWEANSNGTNRMPISVNLSVDKSLESKLRNDILPPILKQVMRNEITPKQASEKSVESMQNHFKNQIAVLETKTDPRSQMLLHQNELELKGTENVPYEYLVKDFYEKDKFVPEKTNMLLAQRQFNRFR